MRQPDFGSQTASPPFVGCTVLTQRGLLVQYFGGRSASRRSLEDLLLGQFELHLQPRPLRCGRRSGPKEFARGPPGMAIEDVVPFKRAVRAGMPRPVMRLILRRVRQRQYFPVRVPASGKDLHRLFARSLRAMPRMAAVTTERKTDQPKPRLAASCGFRPSIRLTRCIGRGMRFTCHRRYRARRYLARHLGPGPRM